jgi:hypothetical protein
LVTNNTSAPVTWLSIFPTFAIAGQSGISGESLGGGEVTAGSTQPWVILAPLGASEYPVGSAVSLTGGDGQIMWSPGVDPLKCGEPKLVFAAGTVTAVEASN